MRPRLNFECHGPYVSLEPLPLTAIERLIQCAKDESRRLHSETHVPLARGIDFDAPCSITNEKERRDSLEVLVVPFQGLAGLRSLCAPVKGSCCNLLVRTISSW